jgi:hypothetical protein
VLEFEFGRVVNFEPDYLRLAGQEFGQFLLEVLEVLGLDVGLERVCVFVAFDEPDYVRVLDIGGCSVVDRSGLLIGLLDEGVRDLQCLVPSLWFDRERCVFDLLPPLQGCDSRALGY